GYPQRCRRRFSSETWHGDCPCETKRAPPHKADRAEHGADGCCGDECGCSWRAPPQFAAGVTKQVPGLQLRERRIDAVPDTDDGTCSAHRLVTLRLRRGDAPALGLQLKSEAPAAVHQDEIGHARDDAEPLEDRRLDTGAQTTERNVNPEHAWHAAQAQMLDHR